MRKPTKRQIANILRKLANATVNNRLLIQGGRKPNYAAFSNVIAAGTSRSQFDSVYNFIWDALYDECFDGPISSVSAGEHSMESTCRRLAREFDHGRSLNFDNYMPSDN